MPKNHMIKNIVVPIIEITLKVLLFILLSKLSTLGKKIEVKIKDKTKIIRIGEMNGTIFQRTPNTTKLNNKRYIFNNGSISLIYPS